MILLRNISKIFIFFMLLPQIISFSLSMNLNLYFKVIYTLLYMNFSTFLKNKSVKLCTKSKYLQQFYSNVHRRVNLSEWQILNNSKFKRSRKHRIRALTLLIILNRKQKIENRSNCIINDSASYDEHTCMTILLLPGHFTSINKRFLQAYGSSKRSA